MTSARRFALATIVAALAAAAGPARAQLYWIDTVYGAPTVNRADLDGVTAGTVAQPLGSLPEGIATDAAGNVYWVESVYSNARVMKATSTLAGSAAIVTGGSALRGVAIDPVSQLVYWTTSNLGTGATIRRSTLTGAGAATITTLSALANPRGIAVDHHGGKIYWADLDLDAIFTANLDGTSPELWFSASDPWGVVVDPVNHYVYWTEYGTGLLQRRTTIGGGLATTILSGLVEPTWLALDPVNDRLYWSEAALLDHHIRRATTTGIALVTLVTSTSTYGGLAIADYGRLPVEEAPPAEFALDRVWPTPGRGPLHVAFSLPRAAHTRLAVYDLQGREVALLADGEIGAGRHERVWNEPARRIEAGVYFVRLAVDGRAWVRRLVVTP
jgi:DNA-binding beta-propeller fold protein YncE